MVQRSRCPHYLKKGQFTSWKERERLRNEVINMKNASAKRAEVFIANYTNYANYTNL